MAQVHDYASIPLRSSVEEADSSSLAKPFAHHLRCRKMTVVMLAALLLGAIVLLCLFLPLTSYTHALVQWTDSHRMLGGFVILPLILSLSIPLCLPSSLSEMLAGYVFGTVYGTIISLIGKTVGSMLAFGLGRHFGRGYLSHYLEDRLPFFHALDIALQGSDWKPLILFQLSSIPNAIKCYGLAITSVSWYYFTTSTILTGFPQAVFWAAAGDETTDILTNKSHGSAFLKGWQPFLVGLVLTTVAMIVLVRYTRYYMQQLNIGGRILAQ